MARAYLGIGSNLGDRKSNILKALSLLEEKGVRIIKKSSMYETEPWGVTSQPMFINTACEVETEMPPMDLLQSLKDIEKRMGRLFTTMRWGPRVIDLDILIYEDMVINEPGLRIPHPELGRRSFVLGPLAEIAPDLIIPSTSRTVTELRDALKA